MSKRQRAVVAHLNLSKLAKRAECRRCWRLLQLLRLLQSAAVFENARARIVSIPAAEQAVRRVCFQEDGKRNHSSQLDKRHVCSRQLCGPLCVRLIALRRTNKSRPPAKSILACPATKLKRQTEMAFAQVEQRLTLDIRCALTLFTSTDE